MWFESGDCVYVTWQVEKTVFGQRHLQGYLVTKVNPRNKNGYTLKWCKEAFGSKAHFEPRNGTHDQAVAYSNKVDTRIDGPWTAGEFVSLEAHQERAGERIKKTTLTDVKDDIDSGMPEIELWQRHTSSMLRYAQAFDRYRLAKLDASERPQPKVVVLWGPPGTGKSHRARAICENNGGGHWFQSGNGDNSWWDGYDPVNHPVVVLDDFKGGVKYTTLLRMLDKYPLQVETKGSTKRFVPKIIVITSNSPPEDWYFKVGTKNAQGSEYTGAGENSSALMRRLQGAHGAVIEMKDVYTEPELDEPDLKDVIDLLEDGTLIPRDIAVRQEFLADVSNAESAAATREALEEGRRNAIDLTCDEELEQDEAEEDAIARYHYEDHCHDFHDDESCDGTCDAAQEARYEGDDYEQYTLGDGRDAGEDDGGGGDDDDVDDKRQHPTPPPELAAKAEVPWIDEVERDAYIAADAARQLRRTRSMHADKDVATPPSLKFQRVPDAPGRVKKIGTAAVQTVLAAGTTASTSDAGSRKRRLEDNAE